MEKKLTKEERQIAKSERKKNRQDALVVLQSMKGEDILKMNLNKLQKLVKILSDNAGISQNGIIQ